MNNFKVKPKKALGQHFLKDLNIAERIAGTLDGFKHLPTLEVGPGTGVLTQFLLKAGHQLTVVEIDRESVACLKERFPNLSEERIIMGDFLRLNLSEMFTTPFCITGNYPYNISSQIFFKILEYRELIPCCTGMLQKEVAERLASPPGNKACGILSVLLQTWYDVEYLFTVDENVFDPPPKVKSAVVRVVRNGRTALDCDEAMFKTVVKTAFNQRRKTLRNSMRSLLGKDLPPNHVFSLRPEQISIEHFVELAQMASKMSII
ncbi:MAG: 16S rRNA (adenine(1518)-N(6)/adenine(1519)-N(6))-dimethyltransferase RsmA [Tannerellaceae bacterium]|jgi:16S rRNA (adenine1518-N6/adenine1519-N6)-dimethyltransferase|nr:16S rRNA (adenine(1518)-N(6)/adenine(1519)-N(6))-dimethyltransferase RsmA [Tannerellaceae bacterium]